MNKNIRIIVLAAVVAGGCSGNQTIEPAQSIQLSAYPSTFEGSVVDTFYGQSMPDPYRWLEDDLADDTKQWVAAQNEVTEGYLAQIPYRSAIQTRLEKLWNYEKFSAPFQEGDYTY